MMKSNDNLSKNYVLNFFFLTNNFKFLNLNKHFKSAQVQFFIIKKLNLLRSDFYIKKNYLKLSKSFKIFKNKIKFNKYLFLFKFNSHNLFQFFLKKNWNKLNSKKLIINNFSHFHFHSYLNFFNSKRIHIVGAPLLTYNWNLDLRKKWLRKKINIKIQINKSVNPLKILNNAALKKFYFNNYFYLYKLKLSYRDLTFICKFNNRAVKTSMPSWQFSKPYLFLNSPCAISLLNTSFVALFKYFQKIYHIFNKIFRLKNKNLFNFWFLNYENKKTSRLSFSKSNKNLFVNLTSSHRTLRNLSFLKKQKKTTNKLNFKKFKRLPAGKLFYKISNFFERRGSNFKNFFKNNVTNFFLLNLKKKFNMGDFSILNLKAPRKIDLIYKFKTIKLFSFIILNYIFNERTLIAKNLSAIRIFHTLRLFNFSNINKFENKIKIANAVKSDVGNICSFYCNKIFFAKNTPIELKKLFFVTVEGTHFLLKNYGFIYLFNNLLFNYNKSTLVSNFKKSSFSFLLGNDLHKFVAKRYVKNRNFIDFQIDNFEAEDWLFASYIKNFNIKKNIFNDGLNSNLAFLNSEHTNSLSWAKSLNEMTILENLNNQSFNLNIKRIKFKPGYMSIWRDARSNFKKITNINFKYQYKLTKYLLTLNKLIKFKIFILNEMKLANILLRSRLIPDKLHTNYFIENGLIYLNGLNCWNPSILLFIGDFIQMIINLKYYITYRWLLNWSLKKKFKLKIKLKKKFTIASRDEKTRSKTFPDRILINENLYDDVPQFLEIDYLSLSVIVLYEPFLFSDINVYTWIGNKFNIANLYNWKYIT